VHKLILAKFTRIAVCVAASVAPLCAGWQWGLPEGGTTLKVLSLPLAPRSASLAGAGIASPLSGAEMFGNPLAASRMSEATFGLGQVQFAEKVGGTLSYLHFVQPTGGPLLTGGMEYLRYDDISGRDEDGLATGSYGAGTYAVQLGMAGAPGPFSYGFSGRFASQSIAGFHSRAVLCDAGAGFRLNRHVAFATVMTNFGWVEPYADRAETAPLAVQAGVSASYPLRAGFEGRLHGDLYRRADSGPQMLTGAELVYQNKLFWRMGYPFRAGDDGPSAGLGFRLGSVGADYAYSSRPALKGNHHFSLDLSF